MAARSALSLSAVWTGNHNRRTSGRLPMLQVGGTGHRTKNAKEQRCRIG
jgi:hypothetical protein